MSKLNNMLYLTLNYLSVLLARYSELLLFVFGLTLLVNSFTSLAVAAPRDIFEYFACLILRYVLTDYFAAMLTAITGAFAIALAVMGSFKGAWAVLFVSVGCFIYEDLVLVFFTNLNCT